MTLRSWMLTGLVALSAACAGRATSQPQAQDIDEARQRQFADEPLCESAVTNLEKAELESSSLPMERKPLFDQTAYQFRHRDRVRQCTVKLTRRQATCIAQAPSMQYVHNCGSFPELQ